MNYNYRGCNDIAITLLEIVMNYSDELLVMTYFKALPYQSVREGFADTYKL